MLIVWIGPSVWERGLCFQLANLAYCIWHEKLRKLFEKMVDERGFEPPTSSLRTVGKIS